MAQHDDDDDLEESGELAGDHALIAQVAEGGGDIEGQNGNDDLADDIQHDVLELRQNVDDLLRLGPGGRQTQQNGQHQSAHDGHDLGDIQLKHHFRQVPQARHAGVNRQVGDQDIARAGGHERGADGGRIGDDDRHAQKPGGVGAQLGDGRCDEADDDQRHTEGDELTHDVLQGDDDLHDTFREHQSAENADSDTQNQAERQAAKEFFHVTPPQILPPPFPGAARTSAHRTPVCLSILYSVRVRKSIYPHSVRDSFTFLVKAPIPSASRTQAAGAPGRSAKSAAPGY